MNPTLPATTPTTRRLRAAPRPWALAVSLAALSMLAAPGAIAQQIDMQRSKISATFKQMNVPVEGVFKKFTADVSFDAAKPAEAKATIDIDTASFDLGPGTEEYATEVRGKDFFDVAKHPKASFVASGAKSLGNNRFEVPGKLTIKGRTADVVAPFTMKADGAVTVFEGQLPIKRSAFNIGEGEWKDTSILADEVIVKFAVQARK